jgi:hypothetical protein
MAETMTSVWGNQASQMADARLKARTDQNSLQHASPRTIRVSPTDSDGARCYHSGPASDGAVAKDLREAISPNEYFRRVSSRSLAALFTPSICRPASGGWHFNLAQRYHRTNVTLGR